MCNIEDFKFLADMIQHVSLPLRARYVFCCAPINKKMPFVCTLFLKFARQYSKNEALTFDWLCQNIGWPLTSPKTIIDLVHLEAVFDVLDLYLWFSYRFLDLFPHANLVRDLQKELDLIIQEGVFQLTRLLKNSETSISSGAGSAPDEDLYTMSRQKQSYYRNQKLDDSTRSLSREMRVGRGRLTDRLLAQGLLTPQMLQELRKEWNDAKGNDNGDGSDNDDTPFSKIKRKRKTK